MNGHNEWPLMNGNNEWNLFTFIALIDILMNENLTNFLLCTQYLSEIGGKITHLGRMG